MNRWFFLLPNELIDDIQLIIHLFILKYCCFSWADIYIYIYIQKKNNKIIYWRGDVATAFLECIFTLHSSDGYKKIRQRTLLLITNNGLYFNLHRHLFTRKQFDIIPKSSRYRIWFWSLFVSLWWEKIKKAHCWSFLWLQNRFCVIILIFFSVFLSFFFFILWILLKINNDH